MSNQQQPQRDDGPLNVPALVTGLAVGFAYPLRRGVARPGSSGDRAISGPQALWGTASMFLFTIFSGPSDLMVLLFAAYLFAQLLNRAMTLRRADVHSRYIGDSMFRGSWTAGLLFYGAAGVLVFQSELDRPAGLWLMASAAANLALLALVSRRDDMVAADQRDAFLQSTHHARNL